MCFNVWLQANATLTGTWVCVAPWAPSRGWADIACTASRPGPAGTSACGNSSGSAGAKWWLVKSGYCLSNENTSRLFGPCLTTLERILQYWSAAPVIRHIICNGGKLPAKSTSSFATAGTSPCQACNLFCLAFLLDLLSPINSIDLKWIEGGCVICDTWDSRMSLALWGQRLSHLSDFGQHRWAAV